MNNEEAKFILGAYRADGRDAGDAQFAEAIAHTERDPVLRAWWERQRKFDEQISAKLQQLPAPPGLRDAILAGARASRPRRTWWSNPWWLAAAAAIVVLAASALSVRPRPTAQDFAAFALRDLADAHARHIGHPPGLDALQDQLVSSSGSLRTSLNIDLDELRRKNCRRVRLGGRDVFEICFNRGGTWFHLYAARRSEFASGAADPDTLITARGELASTAWGDATHLYALVTNGGAAALRRVL